MTETISYPLNIDFDLCVGCGMCLKHCPLDALQIVDKKVSIDRNICGICGACEDVCPKKCITITDIELVMACAEPTV
jgi:heterodisulfide reductase subunit A-like polyferredoxin